MLLSLRIENFALIDRLELQFSAGLNVLTGETGAGKSIILDAIDMALGGKISSRSIRSGTGRAIVEATFEVDANAAQWLKAQEIELLDSSIVVCSRELAVTQGNHRTRSRLNGILVNLQQMEQLRDRLIEIAAQGQTVQLGQPALQREWLDLYGGDRVLQMRQKVAAALEASQQAHQLLENRRQSEQQRLQRIDLLEYQVAELSGANLTVAEELEQLEQESQRLTHSVELQKHSYQVYQLLYQSDRDNEAAADLLGKAEAILGDMMNYDPQLQGILEMVNEALAQVGEAGRQINAYGATLETDPHRLEDVEARIQQLKQICRKYGPTLAEAIAYYQQIQTELEELAGTGKSIEMLELACERAIAHLKDACQQLTARRRQVADRLEAHLVEQLRPLAMDKVKFKVAMAGCPPTATGADRIAFGFSPNPGEPIQPLAATASGGEMSRFLLALKACFSQVDAVGTLIFDEIDAGVSGRVAGAIAQKLHQLSQQHQVLCVTHQPIVAAMADTHLRVNKEAIDQPTNSDTQTREIRTVVRVTALDNQQRCQELAQLTGGQSVTEAIAFARSLLDQAAKLRKGVQV